MAGTGVTPGGAWYRRRAAPWAVFLIALLVRLVVTGTTVGFHTPAAAEPASDSRIHIALAHNLLDGHGYEFRGRPTAAIPPLYIFFLAGVYWLFHDPAAVRLLQAGMGAAGCLVLLAAGRRLFDDLTGIVAASILSIYPLAAYLAGLHLTENLFLLLLLLAILQSLRVMERPTPAAIVGFGCLIGLAALTRAVFVAFLPCVLVWTASVWGVRHPLTYRVFGLTVVCAAAVILPWTVRNYLALRAFVPVQSNAGVVFWAGNNPYADGGLAWPTRRTWTAYRMPDDGMYGWRGLSVAAENRLYAGAALAWIREHPRAYLRLLARKLSSLYGMTKSAGGETLSVPRTVTVLQTAFFGSALAGLLLTLRRRRSLSLLLVLIGFTNVMALLFSGSARYTVPMLPSLVLFAAAAVAAAWTWAAGTVRADYVVVGG